MIAAQKIDPSLMDTMATGIQPPATKQQVPPDPTLVPPPSGLPTPTEATPADTSVTSAVNAPIAPPATATQFPEIATETVNMAPPEQAITEPLAPPPPPIIDTAPPPMAITEPVDVPPPPVLPPGPDVRDRTDLEQMMNPDPVIGVAGPPPVYDPTAGTPMGQTPSFDIQSLITSLAQQFGNTGGAAPSVGTIDPNNDLRSTVIPGAPSARTTAARAATDAAAKGMTTDANGLAATQTANAEKALGVSPDAVTGANTDAQAALNKLTGTDRQGLLDSLMKKYMTEVGPDARLSKLQGQVDSAADNLAGVDRYKLALDKFNTFAEDSDPAFQKTLRDIMERETAAGGFSGRINTSFGDAGLTRERDLRSERSRLLQQALSDSVQDALSKEGALSGLEGQLSNQNLNRFNTAAGVSTTNANADMGALESAAAATRGRAGDLTAAELAAQNEGGARAGQQLDTERSNVATKAALENQSYGQDQTDAGNLRGERDYEVGQEGEAYQRALAQQREQEAERQSAFERAMATLGAGMTGNPAGEIGSLATMVNPQMDLAALAQMAQSAGYAGGYKPGAGAPAGTDWQSIIESIIKGTAPLPKGTTQTDTRVPG